MRKIISGILILFLGAVLISCCSDERLKLGTFTLRYPSNLNISEISCEAPETYQEYHYLQCLEKDAAYKKEFLSEDECVFEVYAILNEAIDGKTIENYTNERRASLVKNDGIWSVFSTIEETEESIITRAAPNHEEIQDMGVRYFRFFRKDKGIALIEVIVREEADEKYRSAIETILKNTY